MVVKQMAGKEKPHLEPLAEIATPPTRVEVAMSAIKEAILQGRLKAGQRIPEKWLSELLGVSRGTVREALHKLEREGIIVATPHKGASVVSISPRVVNEVYTMRAVLEVYAVRLGLERHGFDEFYLSELDDLVDHMGKFERAGDFLKAVEADRVFHRLICEPSNHQILLDVLDRLQGLTWICMVNIKILGADTRPDEQQHREILDAIRIGDLDQVEQVLRKHLNDAKESLLSRIVDCNR